jgi:uncharacterized coiled-coil DUF342 family protein
LIQHLAEDAKEWARLRRTLQRQVLTATDLARKHFRRYDTDKISKVQEAIDSLSDEVGDRLRQMDQTVKDLLQFVSIPKIAFSRANLFEGVCLGLNQ